MPDMVETVDKNQVANINSDKLFQWVGARPGIQTCPDNLKAEANCGKSPTDGANVWHLVVTSVDAGDVNFDFKGSMTTPRSSPWNRPPGSQFRGN